jgi:hypothetical protein
MTQVTVRVTMPQLDAVELGRFKISILVVLLLLAQVGITK